MPVPEIEALGKGSARGQVSAAVSSCIAAEMDAGVEQSQAVAMCHEMARGKTGGKPAAPKGGG